MQRYGFLTALICATAFSSPLSNKQYRSDYEYNKYTDAFYKLHVESLNPWRAQEVCEVEGAKLMLPTTGRDIQQAHAMLKRFPDIGDFVIVATDGQHHDSIEEDAMIHLEQEQQPTSTDECDAVSRYGEVASISCWRSAPFICKVEARDAYYDEQCGVYGKGYVSKISTTGSCYKIPPLAYTWNEAYAECVAEGAHLVVLNSQGEHEEVTKLIQSVTELVHNARSSYFFFAGIRAERTTAGGPRVFKTVLNQTLEEAGYAEWAENEPNNFQDNEYCGSLFQNDGKYNDLGCTLQYAFVCEKERKIL